MHGEFTIPAATHDVLADVTGLIGLDHCIIEDTRIGEVLTTNVDVDMLRSNPPSGDEAALDQQVWNPAQNFPVLECAGLTFVRIAAQVVRAVGLLGHEAPLESSGESGASPASQP